MSVHSGRAHSKYSASGAERWFACPGSVALSEGLPDKETPWSIEGTEAHEVLEQLMLYRLGRGTPFARKSGEMMRHAEHAADIIFGVHKKYEDADIQVETRIYLDFLHQEAFGTFDGAVIDYFGTLHVFDYKYGAGHAVQVKENLQMLFYALGLASLHHWNFKRVRMWIIQPRIRGYDGPTFWEISIGELLSWVPKFREAIERVEEEPDRFAEGDHCHWCKAKGICPLKKERKLEEAKTIFSKAIIVSTQKLVTEADWRKASRRSSRRRSSKTKKTLSFY